MASYSDTVNGYFETNYPFDRGLDNSSFSVTPGTTILSSAIETLGLDGEIFDFGTLKTLVDQLLLSDTVESATFLFISETLELSDSMQAAYTANIIEALDLAAKHVGHLFATDTVEERLLLRAMAYVVYSATLEDRLDWVEDWDDVAQFMQQVAEQLELSGAFSSTLVTQELVANVLAFTGVFDTQLQLQIAETLSLTDAIEALRAAFDQIDETLELSEEAVGYGVFYSEAHEVIGFDDTVSSQAILHWSIREGIRFGVRFSLSGGTPPEGPTLPLPESGEYVGYVLNTANQAASNYVAMPFNSFAQMGTRVFGAGEGGLYAFDGTPDEAVEAVVRSGITDFGTGRKKNIPSAYLGFTTDGKIYLRVYVHDQGVRNAYTYELVATTADAMSQGRVELGKGLRSRYWSYELRNVEGSAFEIDTIELMPVVLNRRLR